MKLGEREGEGHPRYDLTDGVALDVMKRLTQYTQVSAQNAANIVNRLRRVLPAIIDDLLSEQERAGSWRFAGGPYALVTGMPIGTADWLATGNWFRIVDNEALIEALESADGLADYIIIKLPAHINVVRYRLQSIAAGDMMDDLSE